MGEDSSTGSIVSFWGGFSTMEVRYLRVTLSSVTAMAKPVMLSGSMFLLLKSAGRLPSPSLNSNLWVLYWCMRHALKKSLG